MLVLPHPGAFAALEVIPEKIPQLSKTHVGFQGDLEAPFKHF